MSYKAILFDLDGTLLDTLDDLHNSVNRTMSAFHFPPRTKEETRLAVGDGVGMLISRSIPGGQDNPKFAECLAAFRADYAENNQVLTAPYEGISALLTTLRAKNVHVGVVSNKFDSAVKALCADYFGQLVEVAVGECEGVRRKPHPDSLFAAMEALDVLPEDTLYVGDSETDVASAKNADIDCLSVLWGFRDKETLLNAGATRFVQTPSEILEII
ncbi:MAG: HAD family hydrolase [Clostridia bacterium]|nr:HAD family hydrolase [Clostridia bacterium]